MTKQSLEALIKSKLEWEERLYKALRNCLPHDMAHVAECRKELQRVTEELVLFTTIYRDTLEKVNEPEIVICAAILCTNGEVIRGHRHGDCLHNMFNRTPKLKEEEQGFITSHNRFVGRVEGRKLQEAAGIPSTDPEGYRGNTLFSEDLY